MNAEPVGSPQREHSRSQQAQHSRLAVNGSWQMGQRLEGPGTAPGLASRTSDMANSPLLRWLFDPRSPG
jgi:hypothetical protein